MKAKVKDTGEVVDVKFAVHPNPAVELIKELKGGQ